MNLKSFKMLEFHKIIAMLKKNAITSMGIEKCENQWKIINSHILLEKF